MSVPSFDDTPDSFVSYDDTSSGSNGAGSSSAPYLHPIAVVFHIAFKLLALAVYLLLTLAFKDTVSLKVKVLLPRKEKKKRKEKEKESSSGLLRSNVL